MTFVCLGSLFIYRS